MRRVLCEKPVAFGLPLRGSHREKHIGDMFLDGICELREQWVVKKKSCAFPHRKWGTACGGWGVTLKSPPCVKEGGTQSVTGGLLPRKIWFVCFLTSTSSVFAWRQIQLPQHRGSLAGCRGRRPLQPSPTSGKACLLGKPEICRKVCEDWVLCPWLHNNNLIYC